MNTEVISISKTVVRKKPINQIGLDSDILVALIDDRENYSHYELKLFKRRNRVYVYQLVINQVIGVLHYKRGYLMDEARNKVIDYINKKNIILVYEKDIDIKVRDSIFESLKKKRKKLKNAEKVEDSDLDILATYKMIGIDCIYTINFKDFIPFGKILGIYIQGCLKEKVKEDRKINKMLKDLYGWKRRFK